MVRMAALGAVCWGSSPHDLIMNVIEKEMFILDWARVHCYKYLDQVLNQRFSDLKIKLVSNLVILEIYTFKGQNYFDKKMVSNNLKTIVKKYCPNLNFQIRFLPSINAQETILNPKMYFEKIVKNYHIYKTTPFNLTYLENSSLNANLEGLRVVVKGKRGARKFKKVVNKGNINHHSLIKKIKIYKGVLNTNLGIIGITVYTNPK